ncbi:MAG: GNAT family N-acetyltransferase [Chloroflexota bacterium]
MTYQFTYRNITQALYLSLNHEPFYLVMERSVSTDPVVGQEAMLKYFDYSMKEGQKYGELYIPEGGSFGASVWSKPTDGTLAKQIFREKKTFIRQHLGEASLRKYTDIIEFMSARAKEIVPYGSWYLSILGIAPQFQGQGLGGTLVKPILDKADTLGVPSYLETFTPRNKNFYKRLGYQEASFFVEPVTGSEYWIMIREPLAGTTL